MGVVLEDLAERISAAPFEPETWPDVLEDMAAAVNGWGGQLIAAAEGRFRFYLAGKSLAPDLIAEFGARGGADPVANPRLAALLSAPPMHVICDDNAVPRDERDRSTLYQDFLERVDSPVASMATLASSPDLIFVTAVSHSHKQGPPCGEEMERYQALLPHLKAAARLQMRLEDEAAAIAMGALEGLRVAAIVCDFAGRIVAMSAPAEAMLREGALIAQRNGMLAAASPACQKALSEALERALLLENLFAPRSSAVLLKSEDESDAKVADVAPFPSSRNNFRLGARILVTVGGPRRERHNRVLIELGLTEAEASVARALVGGASTREIAERRGVRFDTVRTQIKAIYGKLGVRRQSELFNRLRDVL
ncbi:MAG TPA: helix-turn-helix transcriptional regulator [Caulobacterales bacterium]|nr:helix-turn-helix transcriptional regulator [Caulobacterales bacterium]